MTRGRRSAHVLALAIGITALVTTSAGAHGVVPDAASISGSGQRLVVHAGRYSARVDTDEVAALGLAHAEAHARERALERARLARWSALTPVQRSTRIATAARQTRAINRALADRPLDDVGHWDATLLPLPEYAIHASMLPTGKVLIFGREPIVGGVRSNRGSARVFDPLTGQTKLVAPPTIPENPDPDHPGTNMPAPIFCAGMALLSDGRVLVAGGNLSEPVPGKPAYSGLARTFIFDPWTETWAMGPDMSHGRWYPTLTKLASGDILIFSGADEAGQGVVNTRLDIYHPGDTAATPVVPGDDAATPLVPYRAGERDGAGLSLYPQMFTLPDGNVALTGPAKQDSGILTTATAQDHNAPLGSAWFDTTTQASQQHYAGAAVLEPQMNVFGGSWNVLVLGGADSNGGVGNFPARTTGDRFVGGPGPAAWSAHAAQDDLNVPRYYLNNVLLPDGGMVVVGGGAGAEFTTDDGNYFVGDPPDERLKQVELRRPGERTWRLGAAQQEWRTYHSTAALLPDGRVLSAGDDGHEGPLGAPIPPDVRRDSAEIYWPPYLFDGDSCALRPAIRDAGAVLTYGEPFGIFSEHAQAGMQAVLVAPAEVTHSVDMNQRVVPLQVTATVAGGGLNALTPATAQIAPPGYYMLFVVDAAGTPSKARWVRLIAPDRAAGARSAPPPLVTGPWPNPKGRSCTNIDGSERSEPDAVDVAAPPAPPPVPAPPVAPAAKRSSKLALTRATIVRATRELDVLAQISAFASGRVHFDLFSAGRHSRFSAPIDTVHRRVRLQRKIPLAQAKLGTGILTISYGGDDRTRPLSVRLRAAAHPAALKPVRPTYAAGLLRASGTIAARASGVVRVQLQYDRDGKTVTVERSAAIAKGRWKLSARLPAAVRSAIAARSGTLDAYVLFTGSQRAGMRGEMRAYQVLGAP